MYGKPAPNRGIKRPGVGGRKKGTKWSAEERKSKELMRSTKEHKDKMAKVFADPERNKKISDAQKGRPGTSAGKSWYNNGVKEAYLDTPSVGWVKGRLPGGNKGRKGLRWYNNGTVDKQFKLGEEPAGFTPGRTKRNKLNTKL